MDHDLLIVGQGLAGTLLAWEAHWAGQRVVLVDPGEKDTASKVAAGIINPMTGHRLSKSWRFDELHPAAMGFYQRCARELGKSFYHPRPILRCLDRDESIALWERKKERDDYRQLWSDDSELSRPADPEWFLPSGYRFATERSGHLEVEAFLLASRSFFEARHLVITEALELDSLAVGAGTGGVHYLGLSARQAVLCLGERGREAPYFDRLPLRRAKGDVLELELPGCREDRIISRGKWLLPTGSGRFLAGATYHWEPEDGLPTKEGRDEILAGLASITRTPPLVLDHRAGIRPIIQGSRPVLGRHPDHPCLAIFNGLGSKGVLNGPYFARMLVHHLATGEALDPEVDLRSLLSP